jgi:predicted lactoylglutathione lyase
VRMRPLARITVGQNLRVFDHVAIRVADLDAAFTFVHGDEPSEYVHYAFGVGDRATVDEFHEVATSAGHRDNGAPGERPQYHPGYYGAFVLDHDGHNIEAVVHDRSLNAG